MSALENMYHNMPFEELVHETWHSENKLAKALLEKHFEEIEFERAEVKAENNEVLDELEFCMQDMQGMLQNLVNDLIEAKGTELESKAAIQSFKERCEIRYKYYLKTLSPLWDIDW